AHFADRGAAVDVNATDFARTQTHLSVRAFASQQHSRTTSRTCDLSALARQHLDAVNGLTHGNVADRQRVAGADGSILARNDRCTHFQTTRGDDVTTLAVGVAHQSDVGAAVRVVFQAFHLGRNTVLVATEVDNTVVLLVTTPTVTNRDVTVVVTAGGAGFLFQQGRVGSAFVQFAVNHFDHATTTRRRRLDFYECHISSPLKSRVPDRP